LRATFQGDGKRPDEVRVACVRGGGEEGRRGGGEEGGGGGGDGVDPGTAGTHAGKEHTRGQLGTTEGDSGRERWSDSWLGEVWVGQQQRRPCVVTHRHIGGEAFKEVCQCYRHVHS
jgi:hypothetical protein